MRTQIFDRNGKNVTVLRELESIYLKDEINDIYIEIEKDLLLNRKIRLKNNEFKVNLLSEYYLESIRSLT